MTLRLLLTLASIAIGCGFAAAAIFIVLENIHV